MQVMDIMTLIYTGIRSAGRRIMESFMGKNPVLIFTGQPVWAMSPPTKLGNWHLAPDIILPYLRSMTAQPEAEATKLWW